MSKINLIYRLYVKITSRCYGTRTSLKKWNECRTISGFESVHAAKERYQIKQTAVLNGERKPKNHVGNFESLDWDKSGLELEVRSQTIF